MIIFLTHVLISWFINSKTTHYHSFSESNLNMLFCLKTQRYSVYWLREAANMLISSKIFASEVQTDENS